MNTLGLRSGTGTGENVYILGPTSAEIINVLSSNVNPIELTADITQVLSASVETTTLSANVDTTTAEI